MACSLSMNQERPNAVGTITNNGTITMAASGQNVMDIRLSTGDVTYGRRHADMSSTGAVTRDLR